jgi:hypothetical protein
LEVFTATGFVALNEERVIRLLSAFIAGNFNETITEKASDRLRLILRNRMFPGMYDAQPLIDIFGADTIGPVLLEARERSYEYCLGAINNEAPVEAIRELLRAERDVLTNIMNKLRSQIPAQQAVIGAIANRISEIDLQLVAYGDKRAIEEARKALFSDSSLVLMGEFFVEGKVSQWKVEDISKYSGMPREQLRKEIMDVFGDNFANFTFGPYGFSIRYDVIPSHSKDMLKRILLHVKNLKQELDTLKNKENLTDAEKKQMADLRELIDYITGTADVQSADGLREYACQNRLIAMINGMESKIDMRYIQSNGNGGIKEKYFDSLSQEVRFDAARLGFDEFCKIVSVPNAWSAEYKNFYDFVVRCTLGLEHIDQWTREMMKFYLANWHEVFRGGNFSRENVLKSLLNVYAPKPAKNGNPSADGTNPSANAVPTHEENTIIRTFLEKLHGRITANEVAKEELMNELSDKKMPPVGEYQKLLKLDEANIAAKIEALKKDLAESSSTDADQGSTENIKNILDWLQGTPAATAAQEIPAAQGNTITAGNFCDYITNFGCFSSAFLEYDKVVYYVTTIKLFLFLSGLMGLQQQQLLPLLQQ